MAQRRTVCVKRDGPSIPATSLLVVSISMSVTRCMDLRASAETTPSARMSRVDILASVRQALPETPNGCALIWMNALNRTRAAKVPFAITWQDPLIVLVHRARSPILIPEFDASLLSVANRTTNALETPFAMSTNAVSAPNPISETIAVILARQ